MTDTPINYDIVKKCIEETGIKDLAKATIREIVMLVNKISVESGEKFIRMEMGVPGLIPSEIGTEAEIAALRRGVAAKYPMLDGVPELKNEASRFVKLFMNVDVNPESCIPTVGSMQGTYAAFLVAGKCNKVKDTTLFIDPGFPVQKQQMNVLGYKYDTFDVRKIRKLRG